MLISPAVTARSLVKTSKDAGTRELDVFAMARAAGLDTAVKQFPQDVAAAAQSALEDRAELPALDNFAAEPWPPMRIRKGL